MSDPQQWLSSEGEKWVSTVASIWIQCTSGSSYAFGIYSPALKSSQGYDQSTLDTVAIFKDIGANAGLLSGLLYSSLSPPSPWLVHLAGAVQCFAGYLLMWLSVTGALPRPPLPLMCFYMFLAAHSVTFFNTGNVVTAVMNFPHNRGTIIGIMKGFLGLSGAILVQVNLTVCGGNATSFILLLAMLPTLLPLLLMWLVQVRYTNGGDDRKLLDRFSLISLIIAGYLMVIILWQNIQPLRYTLHIISFVILLMLLVSPISILMRSQLKGMSAVESVSLNEKSLLESDIDPLGVREQIVNYRISHEESSIKGDSSVYRQLPTDAHDVSPIHGNNSRGQDLNLSQTIWTVDFWLLFLAMACGMGSGLATVNNISQIGGSLGYTSIETSTLVSLWSIWNFLGRFGGGYMSDYFLRSRGLTRPLFMSIALAIMSLGHGVISSALPGALYIGSILVGICYGSQWSLMPTITSEIFGIRHMGTIFNTISIASPVGSYILSVWVVGYIYDKEASSRGTKTCTGGHCFMLSFLVMAFAALVGLVASFTLHYRTKRFYEQTIYPRIHNPVAR
ncbi:hypothetical protein QJS04_geneDACA021482 [Acorus gramineus]|uniref:Nodulin-like domain-containing protein n=1 Tax=Acorus gramineus TaxID=55184 RepID=A0AAV9A5J5_ACOGR|nr:hypothetical protein QJS04_geneDACA021482 [Acorus gramineus]